MVQILNQTNLLALQVLGCRRLNVRHEALVCNGRSLIVSRQERTAVIRRSAEGDGRIDGHITGQILIFRAKPIQQPGTPTRAGQRCVCTAGVQLNNCLGVSGRIRVEAAKSACVAMLGSKSENHDPECPYCLNLNFDAVTVPPPGPD